MEKIFELENLVLKLKKLKKNKKIVLCHGVFDILHHGHIKYFEEAKKKGDILIVSLTEDKFVNKGFGRPYFNFKTRSETIAALKIVDFVCKSESPTSLKVINLLKPNFYCKGLDYKDKKKDLSKNIFLEKKAVEKNKGKFITTSTPMFSSSNIINSHYKLFNPNQEKIISKIKKKYNFDYIENKIYNLKSKKILVIGEIIIDEYVFCEALGKSGKEPFLAIKKNRLERYLGGSAAIAMNIADFSKKIDLVSYIGDSDNEKSFIKKNLKKNINSFLFKKKNTPTIIKRRYIEENERKKMLGVYSLNDEDLGEAQEKKLYNFLLKNIKKYDTVIVADYGHGLISPKIANLLTKQSSFISLNAQINAANTGHHSLEKYKNLDCVIINLNELKHEMRSSNDNFSPISLKLKSKMKIKNLIVTRGRAGAVMFSKNNKIINAASFAKEIVDKIGAGDCLFGFLSLFLSSKFDEELSLFLSSLAAGKNVEVLGNSSYINYNDFLKTINYCLK